MVSTKEESLLAGIKKSSLKINCKFSNENGHLRNSGKDVKSETSQCNLLIFFRNVFPSHHRPHLVDENSQFFFFLSALMRYLNVKESNKTANMDLAFCTHSIRFIAEDIRPRGYCFNKVYLYFWMCQDNIYST